MKKLVLTFAMLVATVAFLGASAYADSVMATKVMEVPGATTDQLIQKVCSWAGKYGRFYSIDEKSAVIVADAEIYYPSPRPIDRFKYTFLFKIKNTIQNNRDTVTFEDVMLKAPEYYMAESVGPATPYYGGEVNPVKSKKDIAAANKIFDYVAINLEDYLHGKASTACPMGRCPECGILQTSPKETNEHIKTHGGRESMPKQ